MTINNTIINKDMVVVTIERKIKGLATNIKDIKEVYKKLKKQLIIVDTSYEDRTGEIEI